MVTLYTKCLPTRIVRAYPSFYGVTDLLLGSICVHGLWVEPDARQVVDGAQRSAAVRLGVHHPHTARRLPVFLGQGLSYIGRSQRFKDTVKISVDSTITDLQSFCQSPYTHCHCH